MGNAVSSFATKILVKEIKEKIVNKRLTKFQQIGKELFRLTFSSPKEQLIIDLENKVFYLTEYELEAGAARTFSMNMRKHIQNKKLKDFYQHETDRIIVFEFNENYLIAEFFAKGNLVLTDKNFKILMNFKSEKEKWKERQIIRGGTYTFPEVEKIKLKEDYSPLTKPIFEKFKSLSKALDDKFMNKEEVNADLLKTERRKEAQLKTLKKYEQEIKDFKKSGDLIYENFAFIEELISLYNKKKFNEIKKKGVEIKNQKMILNLD